MRCSLATTASRSSYRRARTSDESPEVAGTVLCAVRRWPVEPTRSDGTRSVPGTLRLLLCAEQGDERRNQLSQRPGAVADGVLHRQAELAKRRVMLGDQEIRIVPEAGRSAGLAGDP